MSCRWCCVCSWVLWFNACFLLLCKQTNKLGTVITVWLTDFCCTEPPLIYAAVHLQSKIKFLLHPVRGKTNSFSLQMKKTVYINKTYIYIFTRYLPSEGCWFVVVVNLKRTFSQLPFSKFTSLKQTFESTVPQIWLLTQFLIFILQSGLHFYTVKEYFVELSLTLSKL